MQKENKIAIIGLSGESIFMKVDHFNEIGETVLANCFHIEYGGKGFNQAIAAKRFGANVSFLTLVGDDEIADKVKEVLDEEDIKSYVIRRKGTKSAAASIITDKYGENQVVCYQGVSKNMTKDDVRVFEDEIKTSKILLLQLELSDEALYEAIKIAKENDTYVILNPAPYHKIDQKYLDLCDLLTPNMQEAGGLFDLNNDYSLDTIKKIKHDNVIITMGKDGSIVKNKDFVKVVPSIKVKVLNTTGAGDTYNGVLAAALLEDYSLTDSAHLASIGASLSVSKEFVIDSIPSRSEVLEKLK